MVQNRPSDPRGAFPTEARSEESYNLYLTQRARISAIATRQAEIAVVLNDPVALADGNRRRELDGLRLEQTNLSRSADDARANMTAYYGIYMKERTAEEEAMGTMTPEKRLTMEREFEKLTNETITSSFTAGIRELEYLEKVAESQPGNVAAKAAVEAAKTKLEGQRVANDTATVKISEANLYLNQHADVRAELMAPLDRAHTAASTSKIYSDIGVQESMLPFDIEQAKANAVQTWANAGYTEAQAEELWRQIEAGLPEAKVDNTRSASAVNWANAESVSGVEKRLTAGEKATRLNQIFEALESGAISPTTAYNQYSDVSTDSTRFERETEANKNAQNLLTAALNSGTLVPAGARTMDPGGVLGRAMAGAGAGGADFGLKPTGFGQFAQDTGIDIDPEVAPQYAQQFQADLRSRIGAMQAAGTDVPSAYSAALSQEPIDLSGMGPDEAVAFIESLKPQASAAAPSAGAATPVVPAQPGPAPAPLHEDAGADAWWGGVDANPVLSAAAKHGEMSNAEAMGEATKVTYVDGKVLYFDQQGNEIDAPPPAPVAAAAPITVNIGAAPAAQPAKTVTPAVIPGVNTPEPWDNVPNVAQGGIPTGPDRADRPINTLPGFGPYQPTTNARRMGGTDYVAPYMNTYVQQLRASRAQVGVR